MRLYLVRHGDALPRGGAGPTDAERPLSGQGEDEARRAGALLARMDASIGLILTSPALRAVATGHLIAGAFQPPPEVSASESLRPGATPEAILTEAVAHGNAHLVVVGHQPDLGETLASLVADGGPASFAIPPGTVACLELQPDLQFPRASLRWLAPPDLIRRLGPD